MSPGVRDYPAGECIPGTVYKVIRRIGAGGMGTVYDVEDTTIGKLYVLKALHPQLGDREDLARRMQNEGRILARLHHPNIVEVITAGVTGDERRLPYYVMESLDGQSLRVILEKKGPLDLAYAMHIVIDLLDALQHAHERGVIHRDVKPDNLFLHRTNTNITILKLLDFGIVSLLASGKRETAGRFLGTLRYAAPEQLRGDDPTPQMDIYCAGLVLFELISGRGPFDNHGDSTQIAHAHLYSPAPRLSERVAIPPELDALLAASLEKLPERRPREAASFASSLRNIKRALAPPARAGDSTGDRATALAAPSSVAPFVDVRQSGPNGSYVVSPAPAPLARISDVSVPRTTARGMVAPTLGPPIDPVTAVIPEPVDRQAATHSLVVAQAVPGPLPGLLPGDGSTEMLTPGPALGATQRVYPLPMADGIDAIRWPAESPAAHSEGAQVRTLAAAPASTTSRAALVMALSAMLGLVAVAGVLLILRRAGTFRAPASAPPAAAVLSAASPPEPATVVAMPAPTLAPPALGEPAPPTPSATAAASVTTVTPVTSPSQSARPVVRPRSSATAKPAGPAPPLSDRPGPGF